MSDVLKAAGIAAAICLAIAAFVGLNPLIFSFLGPLGVFGFLMFLTIFMFVYGEMQWTKPYEYNPKVPN